MSPVQQKTSTEFWASGLLVNFQGRGSKIYNDANASPKVKNKQK